MLCKISEMSVFGVTCVGAIAIGLFAIGWMRRAKWLAKKREDEAYRRSVGREQDAGDGWREPDSSVDARESTIEPDGSHQEAIEVAVHDGAAAAVVIRNWIGDDPVNGPRKSLFILLSIDELSAVPIVAHLDEAATRKIKAALSATQAVSQKELDATYAEFAERVRLVVPIPRNSAAHLTRVSMRALGFSRTGDIFAQSKRQMAISRLSLGDPQFIATILEDEHPQIVAAIFSQFESSRAMPIFSALSDEMQSSVASRMATMTDLSARLVDAALIALAGELPAASDEVVGGIDGFWLATSLLKIVDRDLAVRILRRMNVDNESLAARLRTALGEPPEAGEEPGDAD